MMEFKRKFDQRRDARKTQRPKTFDPATDEADFQRKLDAFMEDMDGIVSPRPPSSGPEGSASSAPSPYETTPEWIDSTSSALQELATVPYDQTRQGLPTDVDELLLLPMRQERRTLLNDEPEELSPIPQKPKYQDLKLYTVDEKSVGSLHTGAQLHVNRVSTEDIPPSLGISMAGLHPHASAWTKSPAWAQTVVAMAIGAALTSIGLTIHKLFKKFTHKNSENGTETGRLHARDWKRKPRQAKIL